MRGPQVGTEAVDEAQRGDGDVAVALRERGDGLLGLDDVALELGPRRVRALHALGEERRVVLLAAVVVCGRLEDELRTGESGPEQAARMFIVPITLARGRRARSRWSSRRSAASRPPCRSGRPERSGAAARAGCRRDVLGALELAGRVLGRDADDHLDGGVPLERLGEPAAPEARQAGDEDPHPGATPTFAWPACRRARPGCGRGSRRRRSAPARDRRQGSGPHWSVGIGSRKRSRNFAGR